MCSALSFEMKRCSHNPRGQSDGLYCLSAGLQGMTAHNLFRWPFYPRCIFVKYRTPGIRRWGWENMLCLAKTKKDPVPCIIITYWLHPIATGASGHNLFTSYCPDQSSGLAHTRGRSCGQEDPRSRGESLLMPCSMRWWACPFRFGFHCRKL